MNQQEAVVAAARSVLGDAYKWGGEAPPDFDCSGLCEWSYAQIGVSIPRTSEEQAAAGIPVAYSDLQLGDLIIYYPDASHVAMYSGNGNVIEASQPGVPIGEVPIADAGPYLTARRFLTGDPVTTLYGADVSNNNWNSVEECQAFIASLPSQGYAWVEAKVSEGDYYTDPYWAVTAAACQAAGIACIGYHYANASDDPAAQAQTFIGNNGGTVAMIDFEANSGDIDNFWAVVNAFNDAGVQIALSYLPQWYWEQIGEPDLSQVPGLMASSYYETGTFGSIEYDDAGGDTGPGWNGYGGGVPVIWQFSDGDVIGNYSVDGNAFKGSLDQLQTLLGATVTQPVPTPTVNAPAVPKPSDEATQVSELWDQDLIRWSFLGGRTRAEALGAIGAALKITGFSDPQGDNA